MGPQRGKDDSQEGRQPGPGAQESKKGGPGMRERDEVAWERKWGARGGEASKINYT